MEELSLAMPTVMSVLFCYRGPTVDRVSVCDTPALGQVHDEQKGGHGRTESSSASNNVSLSSDRGPTVSWIVVLIVTHLHLAESSYASNNVSIVLLSWAYSLLIVVLTVTHLYLARFLTKMNDDLQRPSLTKDNN